MILIIDNYDSFTYNLYQLVGSILNETNFEIDVIRNNLVDCTIIYNKNYDRIIISPGPGNPKSTNYFGNGMKFPRLIINYIWGSVFEIIVLVSKHWQWQKLASTKSQHFQNWFWLQNSSHFSYRKTDLLWIFSLKMTKLQVFCHFGFWGRSAYEFAKFDKNIWLKCISNLVYSFLNDYLEYSSLSRSI